MPRFSRPLTAGVAAWVLMAGISPAAADGADPQPQHATGIGAAAGLPEGLRLPVPAQDVTATDASLRSTRNEVSVFVDNGSGTPVITKLRADTAEQATELAADLDAQPGVIAASTTPMRALEVTAPEPFAPTQWSLPMVGATAAWARSQGAGVIVAVIDTGVDATHPDLAGRVLEEIDLLPDVAPTLEQTRHGTRIASLIAASLNGIGMAGVAPQATILPISALDPEGFGDSSTVARAIIEATNKGARVINLSLGGPDRDPVLDEACTYAFTKGAVVVAAGGNSYQTGNHVQFPAASPHVIGVASVSRSGDPSAFSNSGRHIDIAAPGEAILAATPDGGYDLESGTSFAAPHVAAAVALVLGANPGLLAGQAADLVTLTAADDRRRDGRDARFGHGVLRADLAVSAALSLRTSTLSSLAAIRLRGFNASPEPVRRGKPATFTVHVQSRHPDGVWRGRSLPTVVQLEFRPSGARTYRTVAQVASRGGGKVMLRHVAIRSGTWRTRTRLPSGRWIVSHPDFLKVRR